MQILFILRPKQTDPQAQGESLENNSDRILTAFENHAASMTLQAAAALAPTGNAGKQGGADVARVNTIRCSMNT
jgi:hypothetical protein